MNENMTSLILRLIFGLFILFGHGWNKLVKIIEGNFDFQSVFGIPSSLTLILAIFAEVLCAGLLILGFKTRWVATILFFTMISIAFTAHSGDPLFMSNANTGNSKEFALLYAGGFLAIMFIGGRKYSIDGILNS
ncbi:hypothetical protein GCM10025777_13600 [Membranihabitans marinus]